MAESLPSNYLQNLAAMSMDTPKFTTSSTGAGIAAFGLNCPAGVLSAPFTWLKAFAPDGSVVWIPAWK